MCPDSIDYDSRGQWIGRIDDRLSKLKSTAAVLKWFTIRPTEQFQELTRNIFSLIRRVTTLEDSWIHREIPITHGHGKSRL